MSTIPPPLQELVIRNLFRVEGVLGAGGFGTVCIGTDLRNNNRVAIKLEGKIKDDPHFPAPSHSHLARERRVYRIFRPDNQKGILRTLAVGSTDEFRYLVVPLLGPSLQDLFCRCQRTFTLKTILMLADQLIHLLEYMHGKGVIHCDIKPGNFVVGRGKEQGKIVFALDFGMAIPFTPLDRLTQEQMGGEDFFGTARYASVSAHLGFVYFPLASVIIHPPRYAARANAENQAQSPKDDLESLAYMLIYFARGHLPWQGVRDPKPPNSTARHKDAGIAKMNIDIDDMCHGIAAEFAKHLKYARSLRYQDTPDYTSLRAMYQRLLISSGFVDDQVYDWEKSPEAGGIPKRKGGRPREPYGEGPKRKKARNE